jgi:hypothetical protein
MNLTLTAYQLQHTPLNVPLNSASVFANNFANVKLNFLFLLSKFQNFAVF